MTDAADRTTRRRQKRLARVRREVVEEYRSVRLGLEQRPDYHPVWDYFLDLLIHPLAPKTLQEAVGRPLVSHLCNQAPFELFHAMGVHPFRLGCGCFAMGRLASDGFPALMCPMLKASAGLLRLTDPDGSDIGARIVPTTCDWVVKFPEMVPDPPRETCFLDLPHRRQSEKAERRWLEEIYALIRFLENQTGKKLHRHRLHASVQTFMASWALLGRLIDLRRQGRLAGVWFMVAINSFMLDTVETWNEHLHRLLDQIDGQNQVLGGKGIFLAGSPVIYPNLKLPNLIESAGMVILADDLCTGERIWPGGVCFDDPSLHGMVKALAQRYHKGCICPTFADNERRINSILHAVNHRDVRGVVFHVLKGCHPFDIESFGLEKRLADQGVGFMKIETDYVREDSQNISTRLEAFANM